MASLDDGVLNPIDERQTNGNTLSIVMMSAVEITMSFDHHGELIDAVDLDVHPDGGCHFLMTSIDCISSQVVACYVAVR
eukprot:5589747-Amphidinium_carterae.1